MNCYPFIEAEKAQQRNVKRACELLKVSRAAYYAARGGRPSDRDREDAELTVLITAEHERSEGPLRRAADPRRAAPPGPPAFPQAGRPADAPGRACAGGRPEAVEEDHHPRPGRRGPGGRDPPGLHRRRLQAQHRAGAGTSPTSPPGKAGSTWPPSSTSPPAASSASPWPITCAPSWSRTPWPTRSPPATPQPG